MNHNCNRQKCVFEGLERRALFSLVSLPLMPALPLPVETPELWDSVNMPARSAPVWGEVNEWLVLFEEQPIDPFELPPNQTYEPPIHDRRAEFEALSLPVEYVRELGDQNFVVIRASGSVSAADLEKAIRDSIGGLKSVGLIGAVTPNNAEVTGAVAASRLPVAPTQSPFNAHMLLDEANEDDDAIRLIDDRSSELLD